MLIMLIMNSMKSHACLSHIKWHSLFSHIHTLLERLGTSWRLVCVYVLFKAETQGLIPLKHSTSPHAITGTGIFTLGKKKP